MNCYQIFIEGVFIRIDGFNNLCGFHTTIFVKADSATRAASHGKIMILERIYSSGFNIFVNRPFSSHFIILKIWQVDCEGFHESRRDAFGLSIFNIGRLESICLAIRYIFIKIFKPWVLISINDD